MSNQFEWSFTFQPVGKNFNQMVTPFIMNTICEFGGLFFLLCNTSSLNLAVVQYLLCHRFPLLSICFYFCHFIVTVFFIYNTKKVVCWFGYLFILISHFPSFFLLVKPKTFFCSLKMNNTYLVTIDILILVKQTHKWQQHKKCVPLW